MNTNLVRILVALACGAGMVPAQAQCTGGVCKVTVKVPSCDKKDDGTIAEPRTVDVPAPNNIEWTLETPGYKFFANSIVIDGKGFGTPSVTGNGKKVKVHDDHTDRRPDIKYSIQVMRTRDNYLCALNDPFINNQ